MNKKQWIDDTVKLLKAIKFNVKHPSHQREIIGGAELDLIDRLLDEVDRNEI